MRASTIAILIPYFNPVGYVSHPRKLARCLDAFHRAGLVDDVFLTGAGAQRPSGANVAFWDTECPFMWHKERLVNLAVSVLSTRYTHIVWCDSDVIVSPDWAQSVAQAFRQAPVVQCFRTARYRTANGSFRTQDSSLHDASSMSFGYVWGACRTLFTQGSKLFDLGLVGGGDIVFRDGLLGNWQRLWQIFGGAWSPALLAALDAWLEEARSWLDGASPVAANTDIEVLVHGPERERRYVDRHNFLASLAPDRHLKIEDARVYRWTPTGQSTIEPAIRAYFHSRREDDLSADSGA